MLGFTGADSPETVAQKAIWPKRRHAGPSSLTLTHPPSRTSVSSLPWSRSGAPSRLKPRRPMCESGCRTKPFETPRADLTPVPHPYKPPCLLFKGKRHCSARRLKNARPADLANRPQSALSAMKSETYDRDN